MLTMRRYYSFPSTGSLTLEQPPGAQELGIPHINSTSGYIASTAASAGTALRYLGMDLP